MEVKYGYPGRTRLMRHVSAMPKPKVDHPTICFESRYARRVEVGGDPSDSPSLGMMEVLE